jgi:hypothetical protein
VKPWVGRGITKSLQVLKENWLPRGFGGELPDWLSMFCRHSMGAMGHQE